MLPERNGRSKYYLLFLLTLVYAFNRVDYTVISIVLPGIKQTFGLSDAALGLLTGIAFTFFYSVMGLPLARWADHGNRISLVSISTILFSIMAALSGLAMNFVQLLLARVGVGIGEAGTIPAAQSLIAEHFRREQRARANAVFFVGSTLGMGAAYFLGGWLNDAVGWRWTLILIGLPGIVLGVLFRLTCRETAARLAGKSLSNLGQLRVDLRMAFSLGRASSNASSSVRATFAHLWRIRSYRRYCIGSIAASVGSGALLIWTPSFFIRTHGFDTTGLGVWMAAIYSGAGLVGVLAGAELASRFASNNERLQYRVMAVLFVVYAVLSGCLFLTPDARLALACLAAANTILFMGTGPLTAILQAAVPAQMRGMAIAGLYVCLNLFMGLGPLVAGMISDALTPLFAGDALRYGVLFLLPSFAVASWFFWHAGETVMEDIVAAEQNRLPDYVRASGCSEGSDIDARKEAPAPADGTVVSTANVKPSV